MGRMVDFNALENVWFVCLCRGSEGLKKAGLEGFRRGKKLAEVLEGDWEEENGEEGGVGVGFYGGEMWELDFKTVHHICNLGCSRYIEYLAKVSKLLSKGKGGCNCDSYVDDRSDEKHVIV